MDIILRVRREEGERERKRGVGEGISIVHAEKG